jgi:hypothetical protein
MDNDILQEAGCKVVFDCLAKMRDRNPKTFIIEEAGTHILCHTVFFGTFRNIDSDNDKNQPCKI